MYAEQSTFCCGKLSIVVVPRKQVPVGIHGHDNRCMSEALLHDLSRQFKAANRAPIDAPARIEMPQRVQPRIFWPTGPRGDAGIDQHIRERTHDVLVVLDLTLCSRE